MEHSERLLDLLFLLLASRSPVSATQIFDAFPTEYGGSYLARERKFSRDKDLLRELGIPLIVVTADDEMDETGYVIDRSALSLRDVQLTPDERAALFAVGAAALGSAIPLRGELAHALTKLRATHGEEERAQPLVFAEPVQASATHELFVQAVTERRKLRLRYPPEEQDRVVDPYAFAARRGRFAIVGYCHLRKGIRTFQAERVASITIEGTDGGKPQFEIPKDFDAAAHLPLYPWQLKAHDPVDVQLAFSEELEESGPLALGFAPKGPFTVTNIDGLIAQVLALGPGVRIKGPKEARLRMSEKLYSLKVQLGSGA
jgi:proteasome accessory factor B